MSMLTFEDETVAPTLLRQRGRDRFEPPEVRGGGSCRGRRSASEAQPSKRSRRASLLPSALRLPRREPPDNSAERTFCKSLFLNRIAGGGGNGETRKKTLAFDIV